MLGLVVIEKEDFNNLNKQINKDPLNDLKKGLPFSLTACIAKQYSSI